MEIWKDINEYEGVYKISSYGNVWSKNKNSNMKLKPSRNGYISVSLWKNNQRRVTSIHRLVAEHFIDNINNLPVVDHIDNNRSNNSVSNLRWSTHSDNSSNQKRNTIYSNQEYITYTDEEINNEIWVDATKVFPELNGKELFEVSDLGRIKYYKKNNRWGTKSIQIVSPKINNSSYPSTTVRNNGKKYGFTFHKLVACSFLRFPNEGEVIDHIDSNTNNCRLSNLQIITHQENNIKANKKNDKGINNGMSKSDKEDIIKILNYYYKDNLPKKRIARMMNMNHQTVTRIVRGETYKEIYNEYFM
jgi:aspartate carbamoyltransferase regulatory subunit